MIPILAVDDHPANLKLMEAVLAIPITARATGESKGGGLSTLFSDGCGCNSTRARVSPCVSASCMRRYRSLC